MKAKKNARTVLVTSLLVFSLELVILAGWGGEIYHLLFLDLIGKFLLLSRISVSIDELNSILNVNFFTVKVKL